MAYDSLESSFSDIKTNQKKKKKTPKANFVLALSM